MNLRRFGECLTLAAAAPFYVAEEVRTVLGMRAEVDTLRDAVARIGGELDTERRHTERAMRDHMGAVQGWTRTGKEIESLREELAGRERMVSEAKAETRRAFAEVDSTRELMGKVNGALEEAKRAAVELQGEVDKARAERDAACVLTDERSKQLAEVRAENGALGLRLLNAGNELAELDRRLAAATKRNGDGTT
jgi:DNA repair exonuclease SbcCD ATPase subunit